MRWTSMNLDEDHIDIGFDEKDEIDPNLWKCPSNVQDNNNNDTPSRLSDFISDGVSSSMEIRFYG